MLQTIILSSFKSVFFDLILDVFYFPIWWYSKGLKNAGNWALEKISQGEKILGLKIWLINLFHPMYGVRDWQGKIISFFMRLIQIIFRSILMLIWISFIFGLFLIWILAPICVIFQLYYLR